MTKEPQYLRACIQSSCLGNINESDAGKGEQQEDATYHIPTHHTCLFQLRLSLSSPLTYQIPSTPFLTNSIINSHYLFLFFKFIYHFFEISPNTLIIVLNLVVFQVWESIYLPLRITLFIFVFYFCVSYLSYRFFLNIFV